MKILLVSLQTKALSFPVIPLGLLYIANCLERNNYSYEIIDLNFYSSTLEVFKTKLNNYNPDIVAISIRNIAETENQNNCYEQIKAVVEIAKKSSTVILGGAGFSIFPYEIMKYANADFGIVGIGEGAIIDLLHQIKNCSSDSPNVIISGGYSEFSRSNISSTYIKYWDMYGKYYLLNNADMPIQSVRGCNHKCIYCTYPLICNNKVYFRNIDNVVDEIKDIITYTKYNFFYFVDSVFNLNLNYTKNLLRAILKQKLHINWKCCINPKEFDEELIYLMKKAGCIHCEVGIDSFSDNVLSSYRKNYNKNQALSLITELEKIKLPYSISLILGGFGETQHTVEETNNTLRQINPVSVQIFVGCRIYPKTGLARDLEIKECEKLFYANHNSIYISEKAKTSILDLCRNRMPSWNFTGNIL